MGNRKPLEYLKLSREFPPAFRIFRGPTAKTIFHVRRQKEREMRQRKVMEEKRKREFPPA